LSGCEWGQRAQTWMARPWVRRKVLAMWSGWWARRGRGAWIVTPGCQGRHGPRRRCPGYIARSRRW
jgi:hypothetical protein